MQIVVKPRVPIPPLVRKRIIVNNMQAVSPKRAIVKPQVIKAQQQRVAIPTVQVQPVIRPQVIVKQSNQDRIASKRIKSAQVRQRTRDPYPGSLEKLTRLRDSGKGKALVIIANGPSIKEIDLTPLKNRSNIKIMSINKPDLRIWPTNYWLFCDQSQYRAHEELWHNYNDGIIFNTTTIKNQKHNSLQIRHLSQSGFSQDLSKGFHIGRSSTYAAMQVALWMGFDEIFIFGIDMSEVTIEKPDGSKETLLHFYGENKAVKPEVRKQRFQDEAKHYTNASNILDEATRKKFYFCSSHNPWDFVNKFNHLDHKTAVDLITSRYQT